MIDRNLTVARLVEDHIDGIAVEGDAFSDLLDSLGVAPKVESQHVVASAKPGDPETRAYVVSVHIVPGQTTRRASMRVPVERSNSMNCSRRRGNQERR